MLVFVLFSCSVFFCTVIILYPNTGLGIIQFIINATVAIMKVEVRPIIQPTTR